MASNAPRSEASFGESAGENDGKPSKVPGPLTRNLLRIVDWASRKNERAAVHGNPSVYDSHMFPWVTELENNWTVIRGELAQLMMQPDAAGAPNREMATTAGEDRSWTTFTLSDYFTRSNDIIAKCPETWRLVQRVPGLVSAMFSVLEPGQRLPSHQGPYNGLLRCHLGLIVPEPREAVGIRIDGKVCHWDEGRALIFDDTFEHEARNESSSSRVVLFIDFEKPLKLPARLINRRLLRSYLFSPFVREGSGIKGWWAKRAYQKVRTMRALRQQEQQSRCLAQIAAPPARSSRPGPPVGLRESVLPRTARVRSNPEFSAPANRPLRNRPSLRDRERQLRDQKASILPDTRRGQWPFDETAT